MENATKFLLIAAGMLIAIIIISMLMMMYNNMTSIQKAQEEKIEMEQLAEFNSQFEAYNKNLMYGADVITLWNKVEEHNKNADEKISMEIPDDFKTNIEGVNNGTINEEEIKPILKYRFKCTSMSYNDSGRVSQIKIESAP